MNDVLLGNDLTYAMLERGNKQVWCAVSNISIEQAMSTISNVDKDFIKHIIAFENECFLDKEENTWKYAVPIKKTPLTQSDVIL